MNKSILTLTLCALSFQFLAQTPDDTIERSSALVDYDAFTNLVSKVENHRAERLVTVEKFHEMSEEENTIILDTRSTEMYNAKHVKGAVHLNFSDFTQATLSSLIPDKTTRILIYCNNNFANDRIYFPSKGSRPIETKLEITEFYDAGTGISLALNIPTYINLFGYGYENIYELKDLISVYDPVVKFEGSSVAPVFPQ